MKSQLPSMYTLKSYREPLEVHKPQVENPCSRAMVPKCMGHNPNKSHAGSKNGSRRGNPKLKCVFSMLPMLVYTCL